MATINLRDFYFWYKQDEFIEVTDEIAAALLADKRYEKAHEQSKRRNMAIYSLDAGDGIEVSAILHSTDSPDAILAKKERFCRLCRALNSLPDIQGRRIEAHFILGKSQAEIAGAEGVTKAAVSISITRGLAAMKKIYENPDCLLNFCPKNEAGI